MREGGCGRQSRQGSEAERAAYCSLPAFGTRLSQENSNTDFYKKSPGFFKCGQLIQKL